MPFSLAAVILLVLSSMSVVIFYQIDENERHSEVPRDILEKMNRVAVSNYREIERTSYGLAVVVAKSLDAANETQLLSKFRMALADRINSTYPCRENGFEVIVNTSDLSLSFMRMNVEEAYPELSGGGEEDLGWNKSTVPAYLKVSGSLSIWVNSERAQISRNFSLDRGVFLPYPLISNRIGTLKNAMSGGKCEFENIVRYELSALVQDRVLRGYGSKSKNGPQGTANILTHSEIEKAVQLASVFEQRRHLRDVDPALLDSLTTSQRLKGIIHGALSEGRLDCADVFLELMGSPSYDTGLVLGESLHSAIDVLVMKWLHFLHVLDAASFVEGLLQEGQTTFIEAIDQCLGTETFRDTLTNWIGEKMDNAGYPESHYRYMYYGSPDGHVTVPEANMTLTNDLNQSYNVAIGGSVDLDFPSQDIFEAEEWKEFVLDYRRNTFELGESIEDFLKSIVLALSDHVALPDVTLSLDPGDDSYFLDELKDGMKRAFKGKEDWMSSAVQHARDTVEVIDELAESLLEFVNSTWMTLFDQKESMEIAMKGAAEELVDDVSDQVPHFGPSSQAEAVEKVYQDILLSPGLELSAEVRSEFKKGVEWRMTLLERGMMNHSGSDLNDLLADIASGIISDTPGLERGLEEFVFRLIEDVEDSFSLRTDKKVLSMPDDCFRMRTPEGELLTENLTVGSGATPSSIHNSPILDLQIDLKRPWDHSREPEYYPNIHDTDVSNRTFSSYSTQWTVKLSGSLKVSVQANGVHELYEALGTGSEEALVPFSTNFTIVAASGWALEGVDYMPSSTLGGEIQKFMGNVLDGLLEQLKFITGGISQVFSFFKNMFDTLLSYSLKAVSILSNALQDMVSGLQEFLLGTGAQFVDFAGEFIQSVVGTINFNMTLFGLKLAVETNPTDLALGLSKDVVKITLSMGCLGTVISVSNRLVRLSGGNYDILTNCTLSADDWRVSVVIDPLMKIFSHFVEIKGNSGGCALTIYLPEVVEYEKYRLSLSDIPAIGTYLSNIPLPMPGAKGSIDAGFELKFNRPFAGHPVINEYEQNPPGTDHGREWIELYNPTSRAVNMENWSLETSHGVQVLEALEGVNLMPHSHLTYTFKSQTLDNGGSTKFPQTECVALRNPKGERVDSTPWTTDFYNDGRTWQRKYDGSDRWNFEASTKGTSNGKPMAEVSSIQFLKEAVWDSAAEAFGEMGKMNASVDSLVQLSEKTLENIQERYLELIASSIVEMRFFVEVELEDMTSSIGGGIEVSLVITNEFIRDALQWIKNAVSSAVENIINPRSVAEETNPETMLGEHIFIRFGGFTRVGPPSMLGGGMTDTEYKLEGLVEANIATLGTLLGEDWGRWNLRFGAVMFGLPGKVVPNIFGVDSDKSVDLWLFRGSIFPVDARDPGQSTLSV